MDSPTMVPETPTADVDEAVYPCKGCGEILEEGKAFELAGNRWHIDCFRCNTCNTLLDSDANLLLLGDGSLICNNCTYSCSACGNKIEDLAILTGDQAFCASCFKCRNCKRKIENLRYARTSQGIFCMQCHESLMSRRRKKSKPGVSRTLSGNENTTPTGSAGLDKSLPALPLSAGFAGGFADNLASPPSTLSTPLAERSPPAVHAQAHAQRLPETARPAASRNESNITDVARDIGSPWNFEEFKESLGFDDGKGADGDNIPIGLDLSPRTRPSPILRSKSNDSRSGDATALPSAQKPQQHTSSNDRLSPRPQAPETAPHRQPSEKVQPPRLRQAAAAAAAASGERSPASDYGSPTVEQKSQQPPNQSGSADHDTSEDFQLQDAPKPRRKSSAARPGRTASNGGPPPMALAGQTEGTQVLEQGVTAPTKGATPQTSVQPQRNASAAKRSPLVPQQAPSSPDVAFREEAARRQAAAAKQQTIPRKEIPRTDSDLAKAARGTPPSGPSRQGSATLAGKDASTPGPGDDNFAPPPRSSSRPTPGLTSASIHSGESSDFTAPREAPRPPSAPRHKGNESTSSIHTDHTEQRELVSSPSQPHFDAFAGQIVDEEGKHGEDAELPGLLRKVSKAVKHGRSHSDKYASASPKAWNRSSRNGSVDISSPLMSTSEGHEDPVQLRNKLRFSQQRIAELESEKTALQEQVNGTQDIRQVNFELREKRSTMAFLDTQREMVIRELELMTEQLEKVKNADGSVDYEKLQTDALKDFTQQLHGLKDSLSGQIEDLMHKKHQLTSEISNLIQMKDKGFQEYESLSTKNQSLMEHNNKLVENIRNLYNQGRTGAAPSPLAQPANGLGIYSGPSGHKDSFTSASASMDSSSQLTGDTEVESPHIINIRKGGQAKKFSWKKGTENMTKNVKRGFKGAFASTSQPTVREEAFAESLPYGALPEGEAPTIGDKPIGQRNGAAMESIRAAATSRNVSDVYGPGQNRGQPSQKPGNSLGRGMGSPVTNLALFGTDLTARCDAERRMVPTIVTRCIQEVESRGMDVEGIYRKSGSFSQVKIVQAGFEKDGANYDISDEDLDIHAVTSALKQYLRKLPVPLITFDAYDELLEAAAMSDEAPKVEALTRAVSKLPESHYNTLDLLVSHLKRIVSHDRKNLMNSVNVGVVFAPTIMRPRSIEREMADMDIQRAAMAALLAHHQQVFAGGDD